MSFSIIIDDDFTLYVEEDDEDEADTPIENIQIKTEPEWQGKGIEFESDCNLNIKEELDFEDNYLGGDQYVDINEVKTEIQVDCDENEILEAGNFQENTNDKYSPEEEIPPVVAEEIQPEIPVKIPNPPLKEIVQENSLPEKSPNIIQDTKLDKLNKLKTKTEIAKSSELVQQKTNLVGTSEELAEEVQPEIPVNIPKPLVQEIPIVQKNTPCEKSPNIQDVKLSKQNFPKTKIKSGESSKIVEQKKKVAKFSKEPLDRRKILAKSSQSLKVVSRNAKRRRWRKNNRNNNRELVVYNNQLKASRDEYQNNNKYKKWRHRRRNYNNSNIPQRLSQIEDPSQSLYNQTYSTILNVINQVLGQQNIHYNNNSQTTGIWQNPVVEPQPLVWGQNFEDNRQLVNSTQFQTYSTILQAVTQLNGGAINQNINHLNNFSFQMSFQGSFGQFKNF